MPKEEAGGAKGGGRGIQGHRPSGGQKKKGGIRSGTAARGSLLERGTGSFCGGKAGPSPSPAFCCARSARASSSNAANFESSDSINASFAASSSSSKCASSSASVPAAPWSSWTISSVVHLRRFPGGSSTSLGGGRSSSSILFCNCAVRHGVMMVQILFLEEYPENEFRGAMDGRTVVGHDGRTGYTRRVKTIAPQPHHLPMNNHK
jgi:hypothetical protein